MNQSQITTDSRCLYVLNGKIYNKGSRTAPHKGYACGMDVTSIIPASHVGTIETYLVPNYVADICAAAADPTSAPLPTSMPPTQTPSSAFIPTSVPTLIPSITYSPTQSQPASAASPAPTMNPTSPPIPTTMTLVPTKVLQSGTAILNLTIYIHGIGKAGDAANSIPENTLNPISPQRNINMKLINESGEIAGIGNGTVLFNGSEGNFMGKISLGSPIQAGLYNIDIKIPQTVKKRVPDQVYVADGEENQILAITLFSGDVNNDDILSVLDYNILRDCYADNFPPLSCGDAAKKSQADINNDGAVNQIDYNLFLRESANISKN